MNARPDDGRTADLKLREQVVNVLWKYINEYVQAKDVRAKGGTI